MYRMKWNIKKHTLIERIVRNSTIYTFTYFTSIKQGTYNLYHKQSKKVEIGNKLSKCCQFKVERNKFTSCGGG